MIFSAMCGIVLFYQLLGVVHAVAASRRVALFTCLSVACAWPGATAFHELRGGYYDALCLCLLVAAFAARSRLLIATLVFLAVWTDERALVGALFLLLFYAFSKFAFAGRVSAVVIAIVAYFSLPAIPLAIWSGLGGSWMLVLCGIAALFKQKRYQKAALFCAVLTAATLVSGAIAFLIPTYYLEGSSGLWWLHPLPFQLMR